MSNKTKTKLLLTNNLASSKVSAAEGSTMFLSHFPQRRIKGILALKTKK